MAVAGGATGTTASSASAGSYRVKFRREEFLELVGIAGPKIIYHTGRMHFFAFEGFVLYTFQCKDGDFSQRVIRAIEFSSYPWSE